MNSARSVRSTSATISRLDDLHAQHAHDHLGGEIVGQVGQDARGMGGSIRESTTATVCGYSFFR